MKILLCNERFLFRFGVDRVLMILGKYFREMGHTVVMMGNKLDERAVESCTDEFIKVPEAPEYINSNEFAYTWLQENWEVFFPKGQEPDAAIIAGWPFYCSIKFLAEKCNVAIFHDYGAVPLDGMDGGQLITQQKLRRLRSENLPYADKIIAISKFLEDSQSIPDSAGKVDTSHILLGADHMELGLWSDDNLNIQENDSLKVFEELKKSGNKLILQLGRYETGCYKNSESCFEFLKGIKSKGINAKLLVLAKKEDIEIPKGLEKDIIPLGYVSDNLLQKLMEICDVGVSFSLWEGFNLPIAEMQLLNRPVYVYNVGAHPEVIANRYYLCNNENELIEKVAKELLGKSNLSAKNIRRDLKNFRTYFTWRRCAVELLQEITLLLYKNNNITIMLDVTNASHDTANSGVMRVTRQIARNIQNLANVIFVLWDDSINKYVFPYDGEVDLLCAYNGPDGAKIKYRSIEGHARSLLDGVLEKDLKYFLLIVETINENHAKLIREFALQRGIYTGVVFHDGIPVKYPEYCSKQVTDNHSKYMKGLSECNVVIPTMNHNGNDLKEFWRQEGVTPTDVITDMLPGEFQGAERCTKVSSHDGDKKVSILCVSTLEPRKNHKTVIDALSIFANNNPSIDWEFLMVGNKYAGREDIYDYVVSACQKEPRIKYLGVVDDKKLIELYQSCTFTIYSSIVEGFGMPIMESLWHGKVCLCAEWGVMNELASGGGCYTVDVKSPEKIAAAIHELATNIPLRQKLEQEAVSRHIRTWQDYSLSLLDIVSKAVFKRERASSLSKFIFSDGKLVPVDFMEFLQKVKPESAAIIGKSQKANVIKEHCPIVFNIISDGASAAEDDLVGDYRQILPVIEEELCFRGLSLGLVYLTADVDCEQALSFIDKYNFDRDLFVYIEAFDKSVNNLKMENINIHLIY